MVRLTLLGVEVNPLTITDLNSIITASVIQSDQLIIAHHNLHSVYLYHQDPRMQRFYQKAQIIHIDGMPLIYIGRLLDYKLQKFHRVTYVDWVRPLMKLAQDSGWRVFYLGSKPGVAQRAAKILKAEFPGLELVTQHGYFSMDGLENDTILNAIQLFQPHLLMVGMGMPRQEHWILENLAHIKANAIFTTGACFDYVAGEIPTPPRWMGRIGLEWSYRLLTQPSRLWRRYLIEPVHLIPWLWKDWMNLHTKLK